MPNEHLKCPSCGHAFEALTPTVRPANVATVGARVICEQCFELSMLTDFGRTMRKATLAEIDNEYRRHLHRTMRFLINEEVGGR